MWWKGRGGDHRSQAGRGGWRGLRQSISLVPPPLHPQVLASLEDDYVWIHDYHLLVLPSLLRKRFHRIKCVGWGV